MGSRTLLCGSHTSGFMPSFSAGIDLLTC